MPYFAFIAAALLAVYSKRKLAASGISISVIVCLWLDSLPISKVSSGTGFGAGFGAGSGAGSGTGSGVGSTERPTVAWLSPISRLSLGCSRCEAPVTLLFPCTGLGSGDNTTIIL